MGGVNGRCEWEVSALSRLLIIIIRGTPSIESFPPTLCPYLAESLVGRLQFRGSSLLLLQKVPRPRPSLSREGARGVQGWDPRCPSTMDVAPTSSRQAL